ncbi:PREDICTED: xyloside xylosyltransferase 1-like [Priapulus caudatus]|uniref:Xyloside xylosyltransferase 1-like n=1 Tax=Priapulus caudatus TaxID=37621 RepID=A0ABM1ESQ4_PRICU|nr:PREDICTED: xyloside xylosyltransferase 1-like [Priapulus caudatus]
MPPPGGKPGYNGGFYFINLDHMSKSKKYQAAVQTYEVESVVAKVGHDVWPIQQLFKTYRKKYNRFNDIFYFIPFALHKVIDLSEVDRIIKVDADMRLMTDIRTLWREFDEFKEETIFALAQEQQPVYYQRFAIARVAVGDDRLGMPPPGGKPGYNGGLYLINLDHMSKSKKYQAAVAERNLRYLMRKYYFTKSHLGDQEVVTILGMEYPELFHTLPCTWNRQLCLKYARIITMTPALFELFNRCDGAVNLYHGNCHTPFPPEAEL